jgi:hypothetical protein
MGTHSAGGWKSFFLIAVAIKTPVAALVMLATSVLLLLLRLFFRLPICPMTSKSKNTRPSLFPALIVPFCSPPSISSSRRLVLQVMGV